MSNGFEERVDDGDIEAIYIVALADRGITLVFAKAALEWFYRREENHFGIPSLDAQNSILYASSRSRSARDVPNASAADDIFGAVLDVDDDWDLESAVGVDEVDKGAVKYFLQHLQESCGSKKQRFPANVLVVFTLATNLVEDPNATATEMMAVMRTMPK